MNNNSIAIRKLKNIFDSYNAEYKLNIDIDIYKDGGQCCYKLNANYIEFSISQVLHLKARNIKRCGENNRWIWLKFALLHEIKHAIDNIDGKLKTEVSKIDFNLYENDKDYHHNCSFEKRADIFASQELKRW